MCKLLFLFVVKGVCAEGTAAQYGITREEQDSYAQSSYTKSRNAWDVSPNNKL